jgi:hypothetical protein
VGSFAHGKIDLRSLALFARPVNKLVSRLLDRMGQSMRNPAVMVSALLLPHVVYRLSLPLAENRF